MTAIAAPASVLPTAPTPAGGYDKDAAEGFGALLAANANASNDKASSDKATNDRPSTRDARDADKNVDRAQDAKASSAKG
ncbi:MAG TPA: flagellar hook-length control protein FliK, partial [Caulobacter sp.]|nr:flagellar hook-length control protein FliK [Caulobacter sp.]